MTFSHVRIHILHVVISHLNPADPRIPSSTQWFDPDVKSEIVNFASPTGKIQITREVAVERLEVITDGIPSYIPIPADTA